MPHISLAICIFTGHLFKLNKVILIRRELPHEVTFTIPSGRSFFGSSRPVLFFFNIALKVAHFFRLIFYQILNDPLKKLNQLMKLLQTLIVVVVSL